MPFASNHGVKIYYEVYGEGPPMVLVHANPFDHRLFTYQIASFAPYYRVVALDIRGYGRSDKPETHFTLDDMAGSDPVKAWLREDAALLAKGALHALPMGYLVAGRIDLLVIQAAAGMPQVNAGTIKAFANLSASRSFALPGIPTADEGGVSGLHVAGWFGFFAPRDTPKEPVRRLNAAMVQALADPAVQARLAELGLDIASRELQTPEGLAGFHKAEIEKWWPIIKAAAIKVQ